METVQPMRISIWLKLTIAILLPISCASLSQQNIARKISEVPPYSPDSPNPDAPSFALAKQFHEWLHNELPKKESRALERNCKRKSSNPFCYSVKRKYAIKRRIRKQAPSYTPKPKTEPTPITPVVSSGNVQNWKSLRKADVGELLAGMSALKKEDLLLIAERGLKERRCPNNISIAAAATLEDYVPNQLKASYPASLYRKVASCFRKRSADREHFLTRAGLLYFMDKNYPEAEETLKRVKPTDAYVGRALYWLYRSQKIQEKEAEATLTLNRLLSNHPLSFHALAAALENEQTPASAFLRDDLPMMNRSKRSRPSNYVLKQIEILNEAGFHSSASILADWVWDRSRKMEPEVRIYLAQLADANFGVTHLPTLFVSKPALISKRSMTLAHPYPHQKAFEEYNNGVDPLFLLAIARKESKFDHEAVSPANAKGLMQFNPDTAFRLTENPNTELTNPNVSIALAGFYTKHLLDRMDNKLHWALAAYNAGENAALTWVSRFGGLEPLLQIDLITYRETRQYVGMVLNNYFWYQFLYRPDQRPIRFPSSLSTQPTSKTSPTAKPPSNVPK